MRTPNCSSNLRPAQVPEISEHRAPENFLREYYPIPNAFRASASNLNDYVVGNIGI